MIGRAPNRSRVALIAAVAFFAQTIGPAAEERPAESDNRVHDLVSRLGFQVDPQDPDSLANVLRRFQALVGISDSGRADAHPATEPLLTLAATTGQIPCPGWTVGLDLAEAGEPVEFALRFRGDSHIEQAAFAHARITECFKPFLYRDDPAPETGLIEVAANGDMLPVEDISALPADYAPLQSFFDAVSAAKAGIAAGPTYRVFVDRYMRFDLVLAKPSLAAGDDVEIIRAKPPSQKVWRQTCADLGLPSTCIGEGSIRREPVYIGRGRTDDGFVAEVVMPESLIVLSVPGRFVRQLGNDVAEVTTLKFGLDGLREEARPQYVFRRYVANNSQFEDACGEDVLSENSGKTIAGASKMTGIASNVQKRLHSFWRVLLHESDDPGAVYADLERKIRTLVVDDSESEATSYSSQRSDAQIPPPVPKINADENHSEAFFGQSRFFEDNAPRDLLAHGEFAANVVASKVRIRFPAPNGSNYIYRLGVAPSNVSVDLATANGLDASLKHNTGGFLLDSENPISVVTMPYSLPQPCFPPDARPLTESALNYEINHLYSFINNNSSTINVLPLFVQSAPQTDADANCEILDNRPNVKNKYENGKYWGINKDQLEELLTRIPFWGVKYVQTVASFGGSNVTCTGYHCFEREELVLVVAALRMKNNIWEVRKDSRLSFDIDETSSAGKAFLAPGTDIVSPDLRQGVEALGMRCGTSFAAPVVAGVAATMLARWPDLDPEHVKRRLAATAGLGSDVVFDLVQANMAYGIVNLERAVRSDPSKYAIWLTGEKNPKEARNIYVSNKENNEDKLLTDAVEENDDWRNVISLIRPPHEENAREGEFLAINWSRDKGAHVRWNDPDQTKPGNHNDWHSFDEIGQAGKYGLFACPSGDAPCILKYKEDGGAKQTIDVRKIERIVFPTLK